MFLNENGRARACVFRVVFRTHRGGPFHAVDAAPSARADGRRNTVRTEDRAARGPHQAGDGGRAAGVVVSLGGVLCSAAVVMLLGHARLPCDHGTGRPHSCGALCAPHRRPLRLPLAGDTHALFFRSAGVE